jgi:hypothetical protein
MTIDLKEALLNLTEKGEKGYTKEIEKLDKFAEKIHGFATKDKPEIPLSETSKDDVNRFFRIHSDNARVKDFIVNNDYKKPFLHASKEPTVDKRDAMVFDLKRQVREDTHDAKKLLESKPELFNSKEKGELNKLFSDMDKQGGIEKHFEKSFGLQARESRTNEDKDLFLNKNKQISSKDASEQVKSFKTKSSKDENQLFSDKDKQNMVDRFGSKGKEISNEVKKFSTPGSKAQLKDAFNKLKSNDKLKETAKEAYSKFVSKDASEQVKSFKSKSSKDGNQLFSDKDKQNMVERFGSKSKLVNKAKEIANNKDVKPILSGNSSPKLNTPSKSIGGR